MGRPFKLTDHQKGEAIKRRDQGETLADIARTYKRQPGDDFTAWRMIRWLQVRMQLLASPIPGWLCASWSRIGQLSGRR
jgi:hypothetical protein